MVKSYSCDTDHVHYREDFTVLRTILFTMTFGGNFSLGFNRKNSYSSPRHRSIFTIWTWVVVFLWLLESPEPAGPPLANQWVCTAYILTLNPGSVSPVPILLFLIYAVFLYFTYYKLPYRSGIDPSTNLSPPRVNMALFQRVIPLPSDHVDSFTFPQTCIPCGKWAGRCVRHTEIKGR